MESVGDRIKRLRGKLTQKEFADSLGVTSQAVINYECHGRIPSRSILNKISNVYSVSVDWILYGQSAAVGLPEKMADKSAVFDFNKNQHTEIIRKIKNGTADVSAILQLTKQNGELHQELLAVTRQNGDLRVEVERQRAHIADLERQLKTAQPAELTRLKTENRELRERLRELEDVFQHMAPATNRIQTCLPLSGGGVEP